MQYAALFQVTAQQLWKQVYNMLGGNPRSTSAATCTRRHYEKWVKQCACISQVELRLCSHYDLIWLMCCSCRLLLLYECHVKGISLNNLPLHQPKHLHFANFSKESDDGQRPAKRQLLSLPLPQVGVILRHKIRKTQHRSLTAEHFFCLTRHRQKYKLRLVWSRFNTNSHSYSLLHYILTWLIVL